MRTINNPGQSALFDPFERLLDPRAYKRLVKGWQGVFRHVILQALSEPVGRLAGQLCPDNGAPTKELYSIMGLLLCKEFMDWTTRKAVEAYMFDVGLQYALNLEPCGQHLTERTLERYAERVVEGGLAGAIFDAVTRHLIAALDIRITRQRLDSTHVLSNMASFGRTGLMCVTIKRFGLQVKRHAPGAWEALPEALRERYAKSDRGFFGDVKSSDGHRRLRQEVAEDMLFLVERFADDDAMRHRTTYQRLVRVFEEQCEVVRPKTRVDGAEVANAPSRAPEQRVQAKKHSGGDVMQNPSDPEATYDGHKGPGYQVQLSETCHQDNDVQLLTAAVPQTAVASDAESMGVVLNALKEQNRRPRELLADGAYGSDENDVTCRADGIELVSPASTGVSKAASPKADRLADFEIDEATGEVTRCPAGHAPLHSRYDADADKTHVSMAAVTCEVCPWLSECPVQRHRKRYVAHFTSKRRRLAQRRRYQKSEAFRRRYALRAGLEATNSALKRRTGLGRVRVRGGPRVFHAIWMKCAGWNVLRAAASESLCAQVARMARNRALRELWRCFHRCFSLVQGRLPHLRVISTPPTAAMPARSGLRPQRAA